MIGRQISIFDFQKRGKTRLVIMVHGIKALKNKSLSDVRSLNLSANFPLYTPAPCSYINQPKETRLREVKNNVRRAQPGLAKYRKYQDSNMLTTGEMYFEPGTCHRSRIS